MFGKVLTIDSNNVIIENISKQIETRLIGYHVCFNDSHTKIIGEIRNIDIDKIVIRLIGEILDNKFILGIIKKPSMQSSCRIVTKSELEYILGNQDYSSKENFLLGSSLTYESLKITASINDFFSNHFAILGNTGSGKSCALSRIIQNLFYYNSDSMPTNAHFLIFDVYGEYNNAFNNLNKIPNIGFKSLTTNALATNNINIPAYFLTTDDLALLLNIEDATIIPVIENTLRLVYIFNTETSGMEKYKDFIIAKSLMDILSSGKSANVIRDQIVAVLTKYNTPHLNLNTIIHQPGYDRTLRQCLNIDSQGKINAIGLVIDSLASYLNFDINKLHIVPNFIYTLEDFAYALEFSLINEGILTSNKQFDKLNILKVRLNNLIQSPYKKFFEFDKVISQKEFIQNLFTDESHNNVQVVNMNFSFIDDRMAKTLTKIYARICYNYVVNLEARGSYPIHLIIEEAHRYVMQDNDINIIGYNIFDRITKEGRKYGIILGLISQRPTELSKTSLSQCANFLILRMYYPEDINLIASMSINIGEDTISSLKTIRPGTGLCFGTAFKIPLLVKFDLPDPMPKSSSVDISKIWY